MLARKVGSVETRKEGTTTIPQTKKEQPKVAFNFELSRQERANIHYCQPSDWLPCLAP